MTIESNPAQNLAMIRSLARELGQNNLTLRSQLDLYLSNDMM